MKRVHKEETKHVESDEVLSFVEAGSAGRTGAGGIAENGLFFVDYRNLEGGADGVALIDLDPESPNFGQLIQNFELGPGVTPHHLYYNHDQSRLYNTALGGEFLYELIVERDDEGVPTIREALPIDVAENIVGEDLYFAEDGSRFWLTFMGGRGGPNDGTIGVFDARTNTLIQTISAPIPADPTIPAASAWHFGQRRTWLPDGHIDDIA
jgi:hypothetical protein